MDNFVCVDAMIVCWSDRCADALPQHVNDNHWCSLLIESKFQIKFYLIIQGMQNWISVRVFN